MVGLPWKVQPLLLNRKVPYHGQSQHENHLHSKTRLHDYHDCAANVANSAFSSNCVTTSRPIAISKQKHGYRSSSGPSFLKTYSSVAYAMTLIHDKCAVDCTTYGRNLLNLTLIKPKTKIWPQKFRNLNKVNENRYHEKSKHCKQNQKCPVMSRINAKTIHTVRHVYLTTMTVLLMWQSQCIF